MTSHTLSFLKLTAIVLIPVALWAVYIYYKDRFKPEPIETLGLCYLLGLGSAFVAIGLYTVVDGLNLPDPFYLIENDRPGFLLYAIGIIGPIEEIAKFIPFILFAVRLQAFDEKIDGFVYASMIALGFASVENLKNLPYLSGPVLYLHALVSPLVHCVFSSIWGLSYSTTIYQKKWTRAVITLLAIAISSCVHGIYDYFATDSSYRVVSAFVILLVWVIGLVLIERFQKQQRAQNQLDAK